MTVSIFENSVQLPQLANPSQHQARQGLFRVGQDSSSGHDCSLFSLSADLCLFTTDTSIHLPCGTDLSVHQVRHGSVISTSSLLAPVDIYPVQTCLPLKMRNSTLTAKNSKINKKRVNLETFVFAVNEHMHYSNSPTHFLISCSQ